MNTPPLSVRIITAGAGSGKTHRITTEITAAVAAGLSAEALLATTFTRKAAAELQERVQAALARAGHRDASVQLPDALIGTVNAVCGRLLTEFAFEAGLSPHLTVLDETAEAAAFEAAVSAVVADYETDSWPIAWRLGYAGGEQEADWIEVVRRIAQAARSNRLGPGDILECLGKTLNGINMLLPAPDLSKEIALDAALHGEMAALLAVAEGWAIADGARNTRDAVARVRQAAGDFDPAKGRFLPWSEWAALAKLKPAARRVEAFAPLARAAEAHDRHPRLHADIRALITICYQAAARALDAYAAHKEREGLLDFCDQEAKLLDVLEGNADVRAELAARLQLLFVDEFQDTSPLQLALFLQLAKLAPRSVWVGDPKQAIFGFRGTDPALMGAVLRALPGAANPDDILGTSRRSRPGLVNFANPLFVPAFALQGIDTARVTLVPHRTDLSEHTAPLHVWRIAKGKAEEISTSLAGAVARTLAGPDCPMVQDRATGAMRKLRAGDVAILCKTNKEVVRLAEALRAQGLRAAAPRGGLLETPEVRLALASLRRLSSGADSLAAAEIAHLCDPAGRGAWLATRLADRDAVLDPRIARLDAARKAAANLSPRLALSEALAEADVLRVVSAWPDDAQRLANIEALFACATQYEEACRRARRAGTPGGFVAWLQGLEQPPEQPASFGEDAVSVLTYHRAKGLEWPFVVMTQLNQERAPSAFEVTVEPRADGFDVADPLAGRSVRFWPWPYARQSAGIPMRERAATLPEQLAAEARAHEEAVRLGYVGVTRARDYLVLALESNNAWLDRFAPGLASQLQALPTGETAFALGEEQIATRIQDISPPTVEAEPAAVERRVLAWPEGPPPVFLPEQVTPSQVEGHAGRLGSEMVVLGPRLERAGGEARNAVGEALHRFLAADDPALPEAARLAMAQALLRSWGVGDALRPEDCLLASDRLHAFVRSRYGENAAMLREWPLQQRLPDGREVRGRIDLLVRHSGGLSVIDHKSFPGKDARAKAVDYIPQLATYANAVEVSGAGRVRDLVVHMPVLGEAIVFARVDDATSL